MAYPMFSPESIELGNEWIACESEHSSASIYRAERWILYRCGQFVQIRTFDEIAQVGDRVHALEILDTTTAAFEFAARMSARGLLSPDAALTFELRKVGGRSLTWPQDHLGDIDAAPRDRWCQEETITVERRIADEYLRPQARELAREVSIEIYKKFGWTQPPLERFITAQNERFG